MINHIQHMVAPNRIHYEMVLPIRLFCYLEKKKQQEKVKSTITNILFSCLRYCVWGEGGGGLCVLHCTVTKSIKKN